MVNLMPAVILANIKGYHNIPSFLPFIFLKFLQTDLCVILILEDEIRPKLMLMGKIAAKPVSRILHHSHPYFIYEVIMKSILK